MIRHTPRFSVMATCLLLLVFLTSLRSAQARALSDILLVDGTRIQGEFLFKHPHAELLILRSPTGGSVQSLPLSLVQAIRIQGQVRQINPARPVKPEEVEKRQRNSIWAEDVGPGQIGKYGKEAWQPKPVIVWAHPGESGDATDPANWLNEKGQSLKDTPWRADPADASTPQVRFFDGDVLLPEAGETYLVIFSQVGEGHWEFSQCMRHLVIENRAIMQGTLWVTGNLWLKDGGFIEAGGNAWLRLGGRPYDASWRAFRQQFEGKKLMEHDRHVVARFDNGKAFPEPAWRNIRDRKTIRKLSNHPSSLGGPGHYITLSPGKGSLEIIGVSGGAGDRLDFVSGTTIISTDSYLGNGDRASAYIAPDATVVLLDGARIGSLHLETDRAMATYGISGALQFGTPEKPLTRDLPFSATFISVDTLQETGSPGSRTSGASFVLGEQGRMVIHSADPTKARVVFQPRHPEYESLNKPELGVTAVFRGKTDFNGVKFDGFHTGGIVVAPQDRAKWRNVFFGDHNHAAPGELFQNPSK